MEILGIGASELVFIIIIAIIVLGPKDMQKAGKTIGRWLNSFVKSDGWKVLQRASQEVKRLPTNLMREANIDELQEVDKELRNTLDPRLPRSTTSRQLGSQPKPDSPSEPPAGTGTNTEKNE